MKFNLCHYNEGTCKVPLEYFQGPNIPGLPRVLRKDIDNIPFKVNPLGMQPVIVALFMAELFMLAANNVLPHWWGWEGMSGGGG